MIAPRWARRRRAVSIHRGATAWGVLLLAWGTAFTPSVIGQTGSTLDAVERAADLGQTDEARRLLDDWFASSGAAVRTTDVQRARFLRARLTADLDSARVDYLWVAVRGGDRYGAAARLRLAQLYVAEGRLDRAAEDLTRMRADFPGSPLVFDSWLWTGNVRSATGDRAGACAAWETAASLQSAAARSDRDLVLSALEGCRGSGGEARTAESFSVQLGAFSARATAEDLRNRVVASGQTARVLEPTEAGGLYRVRSGRFAGREEAARHAVRLSEAGFESIVVPGEP
ncbi:MAG: SPOR domain-containing protein [Candidatus Palauibacterales bacterium]|jgi:SPOR domain/Tetratricopeptide repeat|nr:SPOR domain-containing protein [Candidatus Palauibacterales bacterium]